MCTIPYIRWLLLYCVSLSHFTYSYAEEAALGLGERADWLRGSWGALWLPERNYNGNIEGVTIDAFLTQIEGLKTIDFIQVALVSPNVFSPVHTGPHPIIESLWEGDTDSNGNPINLVVPRASAPDPLLSWLTAIKASGLKTQIYVNSYNLLARKPDSIPSAYPDVSERWEAYCDTNPVVQAFINNHPYLEEDDPERRKYMFCYAEFILKEYAIRYGDLIDCWVFDSADNIMEACGDDADSGLLEDQRIYQAFAKACQAGNPNAAVSFNNSVGNDEAPFATPTLFDDYTFGHPFGGAGNMVVPEILYTRNFAICEYMSEHAGLPFATTDTRDWNDAVVGHFFPKQSTTSWNAGAAPCLTDEQFVEWNAVGLINGGAIAWGTPLVRTNLENSPILELRDYALTQLQLSDANLSEFQFPDVPNWRRAETPLPDAISEFSYSHTLIDGFDFWDPSGGSITSVELVDAPNWLSVSEIAPGSGEWVLSGIPTETESTEYCFDIRIKIGAVASSRAVELSVNEPPILRTLNRTIHGGGEWVDSGIELTYDNGGTEAENRAISYSTQTFQSDGGFKLTAHYATGNIGNNGSNNFSIGLISSETDLSTYTGFNPFAAEMNAYSLGLNLTTNQGVSLRGLNFTNGTSVINLDTAGTNVQFVRNATTAIVLEVGPDGEWSYSINGIVEASGSILGGFDLSKNYHAVVYGQDDNGGIKSIQSLALELKSIPIEGLVAHWSFDDITDGEVTDMSGNDFHGIIINGSAVSGVNSRGAEFNGIDSIVSIPIEVFGTISSEITISIWVNGDVGQTLGNSVIYATDSMGDRVLNIHMPWSNSKVYWDAGTNGGSDYDRIFKTANSAQFMGRWNHWVFSKNTQTSVMKIYLNGALWHSGTEKIKPLSGITSFFLGSNSAGSYYDGIVDEIQLYNVALSDADVADLYSTYKGVQAWLSRFPDMLDLDLDADPDGDRLATLIEYVLGSHPMNANSEWNPLMEKAEGKIIFKFDRTSASSDSVRQIFQYSTDLSEWDDVLLTGSVSPEVFLSPELEGVEEVMISLDEQVFEGGSVFGRLKVEAD